ncbi:uncharacterized protein LOC105228562 [Bactrocera dorsalis]|uniref:Uncharacterized protein LOC105228562 n=1 Tax=Bactrocera dorsalis TaxID=27457 RepID=A0A6I9VRT5_BACDO|nr:uncharacterized protein LOC105228562 [Bactrocera dorsalis]
MFSDCDNSKCDANGACADGQRLMGMEQFNLPSFDQWQPSIDFMLWPPGSCEYGCHVGMCPNTNPQTDCCDAYKNRNLPRSPWSSTVPCHSATTKSLSYCRPCATANRCMRRNLISPENPLFHPTLEFRQKDLPLQTPVWRPNGPTQRFSEKL